VPRAPVEIDHVTAGALAVVYAWGEAFNDRDLDRLLVLTSPDCELTMLGGTQRGHDAIRRMVHLQTYGVAQHVRPRRYRARATTVIVEAALELRWVADGELAETTDAVAVCEVQHGRLGRFREHRDIDAAVRSAGWISG
jgi:hypothetical protein